MAARKKTAKKSTLSRTQARARAGLARLEKELPPTLREYAGRVRSALRALEKQIEVASAPYRRMAAKLLQQASHQLGRLEAEGEQGWRRLAEPYRLEAQKLLARLERAVGPPRRAKPRRKAASKDTAS